jgi:hypothetical protein
MASTINADDGVVSGSAGVKTSADNSGVLELQSNGTTQFTLGSSSVVINEAGADVDFRVEGDTDANLLFVDASTDRIGVGTNAPAEKFEVEFNTNGYILADNSTDTNTGIKFANTGRTYGIFTDGGSGSSNSLRFYDFTANAERLRLDSAGNLGLGVTPSAWSQGRAFEIFAKGYGLWNGSGTPSSTYVLANAYFDSSFKYAETGNATHYYQFQGQHVWSTAASGTADDPITFTQAMTLNASGDLGLGTSTLKNYSGYTTFTIGNNSSGGVIAFRSAYNSGDGAEIYQNSSGDLIFNINSNFSAARITSGGVFCVNATATQFTSRGIFASVASAEGNALEVQTESAANYPLVCVNKDTSLDNLFIYFGTEAAGTARGNIVYNRGGGLVAYNTTSDYRAKDITGTIEDAGSTIDALKVYNGKMKEATIERPMLIAHEAQEVAPYAVTGEKDAVNEDGTPKYQQMDHSSLVPLLIAEIQSLRARVVALESK